MSKLCAPQVCCGAPSYAAIPGCLNLGPRSRRHASPAPLPSLTSAARRTVPSAALLRHARRAGRRAGAGPPAATGACAQSRGHGGGGAASRPPALPSLCPALSCAVAWGDALTCCPGPGSSALVESVSADPTGGGPRGLRRQASGQRMAPLVGACRGRSGRMLLVHAESVAARREPLSCAKMRRVRGCPWLVPLMCPNYTGQLIQDVSGNGDARAEITVPAPLAFPLRLPVALGTQS